MASFVEFLAENELVIVVILMLFIFVLLMGIMTIDLKNKKLEKANNEEFDNDNDNDTDTYQEYRPNNMEDTGELGMVANQKILDEIDVDKVTKNLEKTQEIEEIKYVEEDEELEKTKALIELQTLKEELSKVDNIITPPPTLTEISDNSKSITEEVEDFENSQEENAIISLEELNNVKDNIKEEEINAYEDDGNEPISLTELEALYKDLKEEEPPKEEVVVPSIEEKKFKTTPVISPVYGLTSNKDTISLEQTANLEKLNEEIRKTNEFLNALKELRKNLE